MRYSGLSNHAVLRTVPGREKDPKNTGVCQQLGPWQSQNIVLTRDYLGIMLRNSLNYEPTSTLPRGQVAFDKWVLVDAPRDRISVDLQPGATHE